VGGRIEGGEGTMRELPLTWGRLAKIYWYFTWRASLTVLVAGLLFEFCFHWLLKPLLGTYEAAVVGGIGGIPIEIIFLRMALLNRYRDFRLTVVYSDPRQAHREFKL
jgi:hypothetical protein